MPDDAKPEPIPFPVEVTVNGVRVTVTLMLKPGTAVTAVPLTVESPEPVAVAAGDTPKGDDDGARG
jgi:hypothetical protein